MIELIGSAALFWIVWRILDGMFTRSKKYRGDIREGDFVQKIGDQNFLVRDVTPEPDPLPPNLPDNVTLLKSR
jgi:hypothetical protein